MKVILATLFVACTASVCVAQDVITVYSPVAPVQQVVAAPVAPYGAAATVRAGVASGRVYYNMPNPSQAVTVARPVMAPAYPAYPTVAAVPTAPTVVYRPPIYAAAPPTYAPAPPTTYAAAPVTVAAPVVVARPVAVPYQANYPSITSWRPFCFSK